MPEVLHDLEQLQGVPPNVLLSCEPWGHINHVDSNCVCLSSDRMGAYIHGLSVVLPSRDSFSSPLLPHVPVTRVPGDSRDLVSIHSVDVQPVLVPYVSHRAGAYGKLLLAMYECSWTGVLSACDWLRPVTQGGWRAAPPIAAKGLAD